MCKECNKTGAEQRGPGEGARASAWPPGGGCAHFSEDYCFILKRSFVRRSEFDAFLIAMVGRSLHCFNYANYL